MTDAYCPVCGTEMRASALNVGTLFIDTRIRFAQWKGRAIHLTEQEGKVVEFMVRRADKVVPKWAIFENCFSEDIEPKIVDVIVCKVRKKFCAVDPEFDAIVTVWGEGYLWKTDNAATPPELDRAEAVRRRVARAKPVRLTLADA